MSGFRAAGSQQYLAEAGGHVATLAVIAKAAAVRIIAAVATGALSSQFRGVARARVASRADQPPVLAGQRIGGCLVMIEIP